jgi:hypothetical protein
MSRATNRRDAARIEQQRRRIKRAGGLTSALVGADEDLRSHSHARVYIGGIAEFCRQPPRAMKCIGENCEVAFGPDTPAAWLLATVAREPTSSSVSRFCVGCIERPMAAIEADCARTLSRFARGARFEPLPAAHDTS